ncbi:MAG: dolichyl-phosphate beta-glucosyltransferase [Candidatus Woesearchaeota archaeon]
MNLSIVIPVFNEEERIKKSLFEIISYLKNSKIIKNFEIIIVDDNSSDNTFNIVSNFDKKIIVLKNKKNYGKGYSIKKGILNAKYDYILFTDADLATPINEIEKMLIEIKHFDVVIASRNLKNSKIVVKQPFYRQILGNIFPFIVRFILISNIKDTQCGFKLFKRNVARKIFKLQTRYRFSFDVEILFIAKKKGFKIKEIPVRWIDKKGSKVNLLKDSTKMFIDLFKIKYNNYKKKYD